MNPADALSDESVLHSNGKPVVAASDVTRCYGEGDTRVDALRGGAERAATWRLPAFTAGRKLVRHRLRRETHRAQPLEQLRAVPIT